jgi:hypothetical protein
MNELIANYLQEAIDELSYEARNYYHDLRYYVGAINIRKRLIDTLKSRSEFKRALKEYKKQCEQIWIQKYEKQIKVWREHPDKFIEEMYGCMLFPHQKTMLKMIMENKNKFEVRR